MQSQRESLDKDIPPSLVPAIEHLRDSFDTAHFHFGWPTTQLCFCQLHDGGLKVGTRDIQQYADVLPALQARVGRAATQRFNALQSKGTPPAIFRSFLDLYLDGLKFQIQLIFSALLESGKANSIQISQAPLNWATELTRNMVQSQRHHIPIWIKDVCDEHPWNHNEDIEEQIFWRKWEAPSFLIMEPSRYGAYDPQRVWERNDPGTSLKWLDAFADHYSLVLETEIKNLAGSAALKQAMTPQNHHTSRELHVKQTFNVSGANARINIDSTDNSTNVVHEGAFLSELRKVIETAIADGIERAELLNKLDELEQEKHQKSASEKYEAFVAIAANHMTILGPYLPMLGHWLHGLMGTAI